VINVGGAFSISRAAVSKKNARVIRANQNVFWTTQKEFWKSVKEGRVQVLSHSPLTGRVVKQTPEPAAMPGTPQDHPRRSEI
jgi:hypothetical protein